MSMNLPKADRLKFTKISMADFEDLYSLNSNARVMKHFPGVLNEEETKQMIEKIEEQYEMYGHSFWKLSVKDTGEFAGIAGLLIQTIDHVKEMEIAYRLHPSHWGTGYATEAAKACLSYAKENFGAGRLISLIRPVNKESEAVALRLNARMEKTIMFHGYEHTVWVY